MIQKKRFAIRVLSPSGSFVPIAIGEILNLVLNDKSLARVPCAYVAEDGRYVGWDLAGGTVLPAITSAQDATPVASDAGTSVTLANAQKAAYNLNRADLLSVYLAMPNDLGTITSATNATTAASNLATTMALANALRVNYNAAQLDAKEVFDKNPALGEIRSSQLTVADVPDATDQATANALLNALKTEDNLLQLDIADIFTTLDMDANEFVPRKDDVNRVHSIHQKPLAAPSDLHNGDAGNEDLLPDVVTP